MSKLKNLILFITSSLYLCNGFAQVGNIYDSGGPIMPEQAAYDVTFYDLNVQVFPDVQRIEGMVRTEANVVQPMYWFVLDLDTLLKISGIWEIDKAKKRVALTYRRKSGRIWIDLNRTRQAGERLTIEVAYDGKPRPAPQAPWQGGFSWEKTSQGAHWIATTCQSEGADIWWPVKDHVSDEPDSMRLHVRVPDPLVVASNGKLTRTEKNNDNTSTYHWLISTPINVYNVALNIAPYRTIEDKFTSVAGETFPIVFYVLPEDYEKGQKFFPQIAQQLRFFEKFCGPYPFRIDKYGAVQTPHLGMEHQSIIAYGANFDNGAMTGGKDWGFDALHQHELSHEWWGNLMTNSDWHDMWLHEGFGSYMQPLYTEQLFGKEKYREYMRSQRNFSNTLTVAPRESKTADEIYRAPIYSKGSWILHNLRFLLGDDAFFRALRRMAYPDPAMEKITTGRQTRFASTDDFLHICEKESGQKLDWFFEVYLRQPALPKLYSKIENNTITLRWEAPNGLPFTMPVEIEFGKKRQRVEIPKQGITLPFEKGVQPVVDPDGWLLFEIGR